MQVKFEFVIYNDALDKFELDENIYSYSLDEEQIQSYNLFKDTDLHLYNWFKESEFFFKLDKRKSIPKKYR